jgi:hypothetical protein
VLERSDRGTVYWVRWVKKGEKEISEKPSRASDGQRENDGDADP